MDGLEEAGLPASTFTALKKPVGEGYRMSMGPARRPQSLPSPPTQFDKMKFLSRLGVRQSTFAGCREHRGRKDTVF